MKCRARLAALALALASAVTFAAACDSSDDSDSTDDYATCMKNNGVDISELAVGSGEAQPGDGMMPSGGAMPEDGMAMPSGDLMPSGGMPEGAMASGGPGGGFDGDMGGPDGGGQQVPDGVDSSAWAKAIEVCASLQPSSASGGGGQPMEMDTGDADTGDDGTAAAYLNCLAEHGATASAVADLQTTDPTVAAAMETCAALQPAS